jgi:hypothetical protein
MRSGAGLGRRHRQHADAGTSTAPIPGTRQTIPPDLPLRVRHFTIGLLIPSMETERAKRLPIALHWSERTSEAARRGLINGDQVLVWVVRQEVYYEE